ncbi:hypothetical protein SAMN05518801_11925 [Novosphingobium sp. CF614]|nr:hypothetical protein SAMN05518801_11925 [Novosphingobium sp. CF614]
MRPPPPSDMAAGYGLTRLPLDFSKLVETFDPMSPRLSAVSQLAAGTASPCFALIHAIVG